MTVSGAAGRSSIADLIHAAADAPVAGVLSLLAMALTPVPRSDVLPSGSPRVWHSSRPWATSA